MLNFQKALCLLLFHQRLRLNPLHQGGLVHPADVNKSQNNNKKKKPEQISPHWIIRVIEASSRKKMKQQQQKNLQLFRRDPEDLWGQEDQVDPVKHSFVSQIQHLWWLILHFAVKFLRMAGKKKIQFAQAKSTQKHKPVWRR